MRDLTGWLDYFGVEQEQHEQAIVEQAKGIGEYLRKWRGEHGTDCDTQRRHSP